MTQPDRERLLASLPSATADLVRRAISDPKGWKLWKEAFESVQFPEGDVYSVPGELTGVQRTLAELYAYEERGNLRFALPENAGARRRWLGLEPGGALETKVAFTIDGEDRNEPLWRALQLSMRDDSAVKADIVSDAATLLGRLPLITRLEAVGELCGGGEGTDSGYGLDQDALVLHPNARLLDELRDEGGTWASRLADALVRRAEEKIRDNPNNLSLAWMCGTFGEIRWVVFVALSRAKIPIQPRWEPLLPVSRAPEKARGEWTRECLQAISEERRGSALAEAMRAMYSTEALRVALYFLNDVPSGEVLDVALDGLDKARVPKRAALHQLAKAVESHAALLARVHATLDALPAIPRLFCARVHRPTRVEQLDALQRDQLEKACSNWDGNDRPLSDRFESNDEGSLAGELEICDLQDRDGGPGYLAVLVGLDSGTIFEAGTTVEVACMIQSSLRCADPALREALELALQERPAPASPPGG